MRLEVLRVVWKEARSPRRVVKLGALEVDIFLDCGLLRLRGNESLEVL